MNLRGIMKSVSFFSIAAFFVLMTTMSASAQTLVEFANTFSGSPATIDATTVAANVSTPVTLSRGSGLTPVSSTSRFNSSGFGTTLVLSNNDYLTFTITANSGFVLNLNGQTVSITLGSSGTGPQSYSLFTSVGGFTANSQQVSSLAIGTNNITLPSTGYDGLSSIEFRIYGFNASAPGGTGGPSFIRVNGTVTALAPTAAPANIGGRVTANGRGISKVRIMISGGDLEQPLFALTNVFGYYRFENLSVGETYILEVTSRRYSFANPTLVVTLQDNLFETNFFGELIQDGAK